MERILRNIGHYVDLSEESSRMLLACVAPCSFKNKELLIRADEYNRYAYFIADGLTRSFWLDDGEEITTSFSSQCGLVFSMDELYYGKPSQEYVAAIGNVAAYRILLSDLQRLFHERLDMCNYALAIHQNEYRRILQSHRERLTLSARNRYRVFAEQFPEIALRVPLSYVASYLGITLSTLSRLRRRKLR